MRTILAVLSLVALSLPTTGEAAAPRLCFGERATIMGTDDSDTLDGTSGPDVIVGGAGDDTIRGLDGRDLICGGHGKDVIAGGPGSDRMNGGRYLSQSEEWDDVVSYRDATNGVSLDLTDGRAKGEGRDRFRYFESAEGSQQDDTIRGLNGGEGKLYGLDGDDRLLTGTEAFDLVAGGPGDDEMTATDGSGGHVSFEASIAPVMVDLAEGIATGEGTDLISGFNGVVGSNHGDTLRGDDERNWLRAGLGNDTIEGKAANDEIYGAEGFDAMDGGTGDDLIFFGGTDEPGQGDDARGGQGNDVIALVFPTNHYGNDVLDGGAGRDSLAHSHEEVDNTVDLTEGVSKGQGNDTVAGIEDVFAGGGNDTLIGDDADNHLHGGDGKDSADGREGNDMCSYVEESENCEL